MKNLISLRAKQMLVHKKRKGQDLEKQIKRKKQRMSQLSMIIWLFNLWINQRKSNLNQLIAHLRQRRQSIKRRELQDLKRRKRIRYLYKTKLLKNHQEKKPVKLKI